MDYIVRDLVTTEAAEYQRTRDETGSTNLFKYIEWFLWYMNTL